jgi:hypothetical protein
LDYRPDKFDRTPGHADDALIYDEDFARTGKLTLGGKSYRALLFDPSGIGDYRDTKEIGGVRLVLDLNEDGRFDLQAEGLRIAAPFNVGGATYQIPDTKTDKVIPRWCLFIPRHGNLRRMLRRNDMKTIDANPTREQS